MQVSYVRFEQRVDRPRFLMETYRERLVGRLLDVGCDRAVLRELIGAERYVGIDRSPEADVQCDLMACDRLPFADRAFDAVVCTDVLEHLENLHAVFGELVRVSARHLLVTLPNNWNAARERLRRGYGPIAHYGLPVEPPADRHRWFFSLQEAAEFLRGQARRHGLEILDLRALEKPRPALVRGLRRLAHPSQERYLNLFAHTLSCLYARRDAVAAAQP